MVTCTVGTSDSIPCRVNHAFPIVLTDKQQRIRPTNIDPAIIILNKIMGLCEDLICSNQSESCTNNKVS